MNYFSQLFKTVELKNKETFVLELLTKDRTIEESIALFENVKMRFNAEMLLKKEQIKKEAALIEKHCSVPKREYDAAFDQKIPDVNYEIINASGVATSENGTPKYSTNQ